MKKTMKDTMKFADMAAQKNGWVLNPDHSFSEILIEGLTVNWNRYDYYLCPCRDSNGNREKDADVLCPCKYSKSDIELHGHCYCSLFFSKQFLETGVKPESIPERRITSL